MDVDGSSVGLLERPAPETAGDGPPPATPATAAGPPAASPAQDVPIGPGAGIMAVMATTRAMRHLAPDPVPDELIRSVIEAATWAPSPSNAQAVRYVVVTDRAAMARLAPIWGRVIEDSRALTASARDTLPSDASTSRIEASVDYQRDHFAETPALIVICEDARAYRQTRGSAAAVWHLLRHVGPRRTLHLLRQYRRFAQPSLAAGIYPAAQNLLLAARAHGLAACLTTWHLFAEEDFKAAIGIPKEVRTWAIIPIGWPLRRFGPVSRRPVDEVIHRERW